METSWSTDSGQPAVSAEQGLLISRRRGGHLLASEQFRTVRGCGCDPLADCGTYLPAPRSADRFGQEGHLIGQVLTADGGLELS